MDAAWGFFMRLHLTMRPVFLLFGVTCLAMQLCAQQTFTWQQIEDKFEATNPTLKAAQFSIDESRAAEITAYLRPNPDFSLSADGFQVTPYQGVWRPFSGTWIRPAISYLHERQHKRELRLESAKKSTDVAASAYLDQERGLMFQPAQRVRADLAGQGGAENARENLTYWDRELDVNRTRYKPAIWRRWIWTAWSCSACSSNPTLKRRMVNLRTAKIQLLMLLNDRTPIEQFDVTRHVRFHATTQAAGRIPQHWRSKRGRI